MPEATYLPATKEDWQWEAEELKLEDESIHTAGLRRSASKIPYEQFVLLRVLWSTQEANRLQVERRRWISNEDFNLARDFLKKLPSWEQYIASLGQSVQTLRDTGFADLGAFALPRLYQLNVGGLSEPSTHMDSVPKIAFTPVAMRTRFQLSRRPAQERPSSPHTPTPAFRRGPRQEARPSRLDLGLGRKEETEECTEPEAEDEGEGGAGLEAGAEAHLPSSSVPSSLQQVSPQSPFTWDSARHVQASMDEQIVNMALLVWLDALTIHYIGLKAEWSAERRGFVVRDRKQGKVYEARVDGFLRRRDTHEILAILEVKPFVREADRTTIRMQEGGQMAAWISQHPPSPSDLEKSRAQPGFKFSRLLVSQDRHQIFLTFARFDAEYVAYICDTAAEEDRKAFSFLHMEEYGPFNTTSASHMRGLGELMLAICLELCNATVIPT